VPISIANFNSALNSIIDRFVRDIKKIYRAIIFQIVFFTVVIFLTTFTSFNQDHILWIISIIGIAGIGVTADFEHLRATLKDAFNDLKTLKDVKETLVAIPDMIKLSPTPNDERVKYATFLRTTLRKVLLGADPNTLMQEVTNVLS